MATQACYHEHTRTIDSRLSARSFVRRRRRLECKDCGVRFTTVEITALDLKVVKDWEFEQWINRRIAKARRWKSAGETSPE